MLALSQHAQHSDLVADEVVFLTNLSAFWILVPRQLRALSERNAPAVIAVVIVVI
jgi:hypothetical protein